MEVKYIKVDLQPYKDILHIKNDFGSWASHAFHPSTWKAWAEDLCELMTMLAYMPELDGEAQPQKGQGVRDDFSRSLN